MFWPRPIPLQDPDLSGDLSEHRPLEAHSPITLDPDAPFLDDQPVRVEA
jgi:hypothetical protein